MQSLSCAGASTWNNLLDNFESAGSVSSFKRSIKKYFPKRLDDIEAGI